VVLSKTGGAYRIHTGGEAVEAALRGRLKRGESKQILVGDVVTLHVHADDSMTIEEVQDRRSLLKRRYPGRKHGVRDIAANVDQVVVVGAARHPEWDAHLMDRFTAVAAANDLPLVVVVNKCDLVSEPSILGVPYQQAGYPVVHTSVKNAAGLAELRRHLTGHISLFTGPTGVGKSSLLNALQPGLRLRTAAVSGKSQAGRHTTVSAEMYPFGEDGFVVDTPGLRDIGLWGLEPMEVAAAFPEFAARAMRCRFDNCRHVQEPDCAVAEAVTRGDIAASRLQSYRRMLEEADQASRPWSSGRSK
jgi:ribosome biogenesis GTPase